MCLSRVVFVSGDRDSSVHPTLLSTMPYGAVELVEKIECKNHLLRNFRSWVLELSNNTKFPLPPGVPPKDVKAMRREVTKLRTVIRGHMVRLSSAIDKASSKRGGEDGK